MRSRSIVLALLIAGAAAGSARADQSLEDRVRELEKTVHRQSELLHRQAAEEEAAEETARRKASEESKSVTVTTGYEGLEVVSADERFSFGVGGRIQADAAFYDEGVSPLGNGAELRRARLKGFGKMWKDWSYKLEVNFDPDGEVEITDAWLRYTGFKPMDVPTQIAVGHQKVPFSQQSMTSSNWQVFQERSMQDAFIDNKATGRRRLGITAGGYGDFWNANTGFFGEGVDDSGSAREGWGGAGRVIAFPIIGDTKLLKGGGAVYYRSLSGDKKIDFAARPESHIAGTKMIDTGKLTNVENLLLYNAGVSGLWGPLHAQAEFTGVDVSRDTLSSVSFHGWYAQAGYFFTGESRRFDKKSGKFKRVMPKSVVGDGGIGAWEMAVRYSDMNLDDKDVRGGRERDLTVGINWWATPSILFRLDYVYANVDPNSGETLQGVHEVANVFEGRAQIVF